jgi:hypothetical protein
MFCKTNRRTLYLYSSGAYHCHRCKAHGKIVDLKNIDVKFDLKQNHELSSVWNNRGKRESLVRNRHFENRVDVFQVKNSKGEITGEYKRSPGKKSETIGKRYFGYRRDYLEIGETYRIVEGPYDVIYPEDVCVFGIPNKTQARDLKHQKLILCPDGDMWKQRETIFDWLSPFVYNQVVAVERLPIDKDPDEVPRKEREIISWDKIKPYL